MLQRIQTLYLLIFIAAQALMLPFPFLYFTKENISCSLMAKGILEENGQILLSDNKAIIGIILGMISALIAVFLFKKRPLQMKLTRALTFLCIAQLSFVFFNAMAILKENLKLNGIGLSVLFLVIALVSSILAYKGIKKDEDLIKSVDRIR